MAISPAKAGELVKPYLLNVCVDAPVTRAIPVLLVVERGTDGLAVVILARWASPPDLLRSKRADLGDHRGRGGVGGR